MKKKWLYRDKGKKRRYLYGRRLRWWHNASNKYTSPGQILLHSLEKAAGGIDPHVNADKT